MSSRNGSSIIKSDAYPTPPHVVAALLKMVTFNPTDTFLEPCRGVERNIYNQIPLPDDKKYWAELAEGIDYLTTPFQPVDVIITNPPFSCSEEFIEKCLSELKPGGTFIFLQRVNFLGSIKRVDFWRKVGMPQKQSVIVPRPRFALGGTDSCEYAWFVFDLGNRTSRMEGPISHCVSDWSVVENHRYREAKKKILPTGTRTVKTGSAA